MYQIQKHILIVADTFLPSRNSAAVQLFDLSTEFVRSGYKLTVLIPNFDQKENIIIENKSGVKVLKIKAPRTKDLNYIQRTINEFLMPFVMFKRLKKSIYYEENIDGLVWYSPSIFHGPLIKRLKEKHKCKAYLILRDVFPEWAYDMGLMRKGLPYLFFKVIANYQYTIADIIGVQSKGNLSYFKKLIDKSKVKLTVLNNWLSSENCKGCSINIQNTKLATRKIFVYAGNMGVAQGMDIIMDLVYSLRSDDKIGFVLVGRGSEVKRIEDFILSFKLNNILLYDEIDPTEIPGLFDQCHVGIVSLDSRHKSHNIPGKFLTYIKHGLPILASINKGNDLADMIRQERIGHVCDTNNSDDLLIRAKELLIEIENDIDISLRCKNLFEREFTSFNAVKNIEKEIFTP